MIAQPQGLGQRLQPDRRAGELLVAEVVVGAPGGEHQVVERDVLAHAGPDGPAREIHRRDDVLAEPHVWRSAEAPAKRVGDVGGVQERGGDLVQERREQVVVAAIQQHHVEGLAVELSRARQATETTAHDDDSFSHRCHANLGYH